MRAWALMAIISFNLNSRWHFALEFVSSTNKQHQFDTFKPNENLYGIFSAYIFTILYNVYVHMNIRLHEQTIVKSEIEERGRRRRQRRGPIQRHYYCIWFVEFYRSDGKYTIQFSIRTSLCDCFDFVDFHTFSIWFSSLTHFFTQARYFKSIEFGSCVELTIIDSNHEVACNQTIMTLISIFLRPHYSPLSPSLSDFIQLLFSCRCGQPKQSYFDFHFNN